MSLDGENAVEISFADRDLLRSSCVGEAQSTMMQSVIRLADRGADTSVLVMRSALGCNTTFVLLSRLPYRLRELFVDFIIMATIRDAGIHGDFVHEHLQDPHTEIRLIHVDLSGEVDE